MSDTVPPADPILGRLSAIRVDVGVDLDALAVAVDAERATHRADVAALEIEVANLETMLDERDAVVDAGNATIVRLTAELDRARARIAELEADDDDTPLPPPPDQVIEPGGADGGGGAGDPGSDPVEVGGFDADWSEPAGWSDLADVRAAELDVRRASFEAGT